MNIADLFAKLRIIPDQKSFDATSKAIEGVKTALVGLAAYAGIHALKGFVDETIEAGSHINDLAQETSVSTDELQEFGFIAKQNSSSMDEFGHAMVKLQKNMEAATHGGQAQRKGFSDLGVSIRDAQGKLRPAADVFEDISLAQRKMTDESKRTNAGMATMGRGFNRLLPTMNQIADDGLGNLKDEAHDLGVVIDGEAISALDSLGDTQDKVKMSLEGLRNSAVITLIPVLKDMLDGLLKWVKANRAIVAQKLEFVLRGLAAAVRVVALGISKLVGLLEFLGNNMGLVLVGVVSLGAAFLILRGQAVAAAVASAWAWVRASLPLILLVAAIAAAILMFNSLIVAFEGGDSVIEDFLEKRMGVEFVDKMKRVAGAIGAAFKSVFDFLNTSIDALLKRAEKIGEFIFNLTHYSNQDRVDQRDALIRAFGPLGRAAANSSNFSIDAVRTTEVVADEVEARAAKPFERFDTAGGIDRTETSTKVTMVTPTFNVTLQGAGADPANALLITNTLDEWWGGITRGAEIGIGGIK